jgi:putative peptidoglycan lipid II flippase
MSDRTRKLGFAATILIVTVLLSRVLGFVRDAVIAALFGATGQTDAFWAAFTIPDILSYLVAGGTLSITFIPIYSRYLSEGNEAEGNRIFSIISTTMMIVVVAGVIVLEIFTPQITHAYLHKLQPRDMDLAVHLTRILLPAQLCFYIGGLAAATLYARHRFVAASIAPLIYNLGTIAGGALLGRRYGIASLAWGTLAGAFGHLTLQLIAAGRAGLRWRPSLRVTHPQFKSWLLLSLPLMVGVGIVTADDWFIRYFAAADPGAISCLNYARKLVQVPIAVAGQAVGQASMPFFARLWAEGKRVELGDLVTKAARTVAAVAALAAWALIALAVPAVELLFHRGHFAAAQVEPTAVYVALFALAIPVWGMQGIIARAFYATGDTFTPMAAATAIVVLVLPIYWIMQRLFTIDGLVISSGIAIVLHTGVLMLLLPRRLDTCRRGEIVNGTLRSFALGAIAAVPTWLVSHYLPHGRLGGHALSLVQLAVGGLVFIAVAAPLARPLGASDAHAFFDRLFGRLARRLFAERSLR